MTLGAILRFNGTFLKIQLTLIFKNTTDKKLIPWMHLSFMNKNNIKEK